MRREAEEMGEPQLRLVLPDDPQPVAPWSPAATPGGPARRVSGPAISVPATTATTPDSGPGSGPVAGATNTATSDPERGATSGPSAEAAAGFELELYGRPMTTTEKGARLVRHLAGMTAENLGRPGGLGHGIIRGHPSSAGQHLGYVRSRAWVPEGLEGGAVSKAGAVYGYTIGLAGVLIGNCITWTFERPLRLFLACLVVGVAVLIIALTW
jgi:hypothetical protein